VPSSPAVQHVEAQSAGAGAVGSSQRGRPGRRCGRRRQSTAGTPRKPVPVMSAVHGRDAQGARVGFSRLGTSRTREILSTKSQAKMQGRAGGRLGPSAREVQCAHSVGASSLRRGRQGPSGNEESLMNLGSVLGSSNDPESATNGFGGACVRRTSTSGRLVMGGAGRTAYVRPLRITLYELRQRPVRRLRLGPQIALQLPIKSDCGL